MYMAVIWLLMAFGLSLAGISAIADDRRILIPAGVVFIVISMMIIPSGIQTQNGISGHSEKFTNATNTTIKDFNKTKTYENINSQYNLDMSTYISVIFAGVGLFFVLTGVVGRGGVEAVPFRK